MRRILLALGVLVVVGSGTLALLKSSPALAYPGCPNGQYADFGRNTFYGYFGSPCYNGFGDVLEHNPAGGNSVPNSINSAAKLIAWVQGLLAGNAQEKTAGEFYILTMLPSAPGYPYPDYNRGDANKRFAEWSADVKNAETEGRIKWFYNYPFPCGTKNTMYMMPFPKNGTGYNDVSFFFQEAGDPTTPCGPNVTVPSIALYDRTGALVYDIKRFCGNPIGKLNAIPTAKYTVQPSGWANQTQVIRGQTDTLHVQLDNLGPAASENGTLQVHPVTPAGSAIPGSVAQPCAPNCVGPGQTTLKAGATTYSTADGYRNTTMAGFNGPDWYWNVKSIPNGGKPTATFDITIAANAPTTGPNNVITFNVCFNPAKEDGNAICATFTVTVVSARYPTYAGLNGDIQAGGGICKLAQTDGKVEGHAPTAASNQLSYGQYVVSSSLVNGIINFRSNGAVGSPGADSLKIGASGGYAKICRPDLLKAANDYVSGGGTGYNQRSGPYDINLSSGDPAMSLGVLYINGSATVHGTISSKLTIIASGDVTFTGNVQLTGVASPDPYKVPSLGIISGGNINIPAGVTRVDAYLFAGSPTSVIDTCSDFATTSCSTAQLVVNGFFMANNIYFHRLGPKDSNGAPVTELVALNPQIYLNPPKFFDSSVDDTSLLSGGEKPPLF